MSATPAKRLPPLLLMLLGGIAASLIAEAILCGRASMQVFAAPDPMLGATGAALDPEMIGIGVAYAVLMVADLVMARALFGAGQAHRTSRIAATIALAVTITPAVRIFLHDAAYSPFLFVLSVLKPYGPLISPFIETNSQVYVAVMCMYGIAIAVHLLALVLLFLPPKRSGSGSSAASDKSMPVNEPG